MTRRVYLSPRCSSANTSHVSMGYDIVEWNARPHQPTLSPMGSFGGVRIYKDCHDGKNTHTHPNRGSAESADKCNFTSKHQDGCAYACMCAVFSYVRWRESQTDTDTQNHENLTTWMCVSKTIFCIRVHGVKRYSAFVLPACTPVTLHTGSRFVSLSYPVPTTQPKMPPCRLE